VVLDLMLPGQDGLAALRELRLEAPRLPVLILSARDRVDDRVTGLELGSDDYLVKPFSFAELLARVRALLRRGQPARTSIAVGPLELDLLAQEARARGAPIGLTRREFALLACLGRHRDEDVSREMLTREVWRGAHRAPPLDNVLDVHVARLRRKLEDAGLPPLIHTVRGVGYRLSEREP
jgi:two-component system copper resistance phosphate regulon response regulator CusR